MIPRCKNVPTESRPAEGRAKYTARAKKPKAG